MTRPIKSEEVTSVRGANAVRKFNLQTWEKVQEQFNNEAPNATVPLSTVLGADYLALETDGTDDHENQKMGFPKRWITHFSEPLYCPK